MKQAEGERQSYRDEDEHRGSWRGGGRSYEQRSREDKHDERHGQSGWFGDPEGHSEASRRGWEHRLGSNQTLDSDPASGGRYGAFWERHREPQRAVRR